MVVFSDEEKKILDPYVSNTEGNIFVVNIPCITGAAFARYSRAKGGMLETIMNEFLREGNIDQERADKLIERVLIAFGDDSVGELEGVHVGVEQISNLATKIIEDKRIGISPIEQSTRYVFYNQKDDQGRFRYLREPRIMQSEHAQKFEETMDFCFQTYCDLIEPMQGHFRKMLPIEEAEFKLRETWDRKKRLEELTDETERKDFEKTYRETIRTKACDTIRIVLPTATLTNVGLFANGRALQGLLTSLYSYPLAETQTIATQMHTELNKYIRRYVQRAKKDEYIVITRDEMQKLADELFKDIKPESEENIVLLQLLQDPRTEQEREDFKLASMLFPFLTHPTKQIREVIKQFPEEIKERISDTYNGERKNRRDRAGRGLEFGYEFTFDLIGNFGIYRDLHRHRMLTQQRQKLTTRLGFSVPQEIYDARLADSVWKAEGRSSELYERMKSEFPEEAQYVTLFGHNIRWSLGMNEREATHLLELRTIPQGHQDYRRMCQKMHHQIKERNPMAAKRMGFVDHNQYPFARGDSEAKIRAREAKR